MRNSAAVALRQSDQHCQDLVAQSATFIRSTYYEFKSMHPDLPLACALGLAIKQNQSWVGGWCIKALAATLDISIVVLCSNALQLYKQLCGPVQASQQQQLQARVGAASIDFVNPEFSKAKL